MKYSKRSTTYRDIWLFIALMALWAYTHDMSYQETVINSYYFSGE